MHRSSHRQDADRQAAGSTRSQPFLRRTALLAGLLVIALATFAGTPARGRADGGLQPATPVPGTFRTGTAVRSTLHRTGSATPRAAVAAAAPTTLTPRSVPVHYPYASPPVQAARAAAAATAAN